MSDPHALATNNMGAELLQQIDRGVVKVNATKSGGMYNGWTLLHCAAAKGHTQLAAELMRRAANPDARNGKGVTCWQLAFDKGHTQLGAAIKGNSAGGVGGGVGGVGGGAGGGVGGGAAPVRSIPTPRSLVASSTVNEDGFLVTEEPRYIIKALSQLSLPTLSPNSLSQLSLPTPSPNSLSQLPLPTLSPNSLSQLSLPTLSPHSLSNCVSPSLSQLSSHPTPNFSMYAFVSLTLT